MDYIRGLGHSSLYGNRSASNDQEIIPSDDEPSDSEDGLYDLQDLLYELRTRSITPIMTPRDIQNAHRVWSLHHDAQRNGPMVPIKTSHVLDSRIIEKRHLGKLVKVKTILHICRFNILSAVQIRTIIPSSVASDSEEYIKLCSYITDYSAKCHVSAIRYIKTAAAQIADMVNTACGAGFFSRLTRSDRYLVFGAVFDQFPAYTMSKFRSYEKEWVDFAEIFSKSHGRRDLEDKQKWRKYYRYSFVYMCDRTWLEQEYGIGGIDEAWLWLSWRERVQAMRLGGAYDLPAVAGKMFERVEISRSD